MSYIPPRPTTEDRYLWQEYWQALGQKWRIEPEISIERQQYLVSLSQAKQEGEPGIHPFQNVELCRGDVEWLLERGSHALSQPSKRGNRPTSGNIPGSILTNTALVREKVTNKSVASPAADDSGSFKPEIDHRDNFSLESQLPEIATEYDLLERHPRSAKPTGGNDLFMEFSLPDFEGDASSDQTINPPVIEVSNSLVNEPVLFQNLIEDEYQYKFVQLDIRGAVLNGVDLHALPLEEADLRDTYLEEVYLYEAILRRANLSGADLRGAIFCFEDWEAQAWNGYSAHLEGADLSRAHLEGADLRQAHLAGADLSAAHLEGADLSQAHLAGANLHKAFLRGARLTRADLVEADLGEAHLERADLSEAHLKRVNFSKAFLHGINLHEAYLEEADLHETDLQAVDLQRANLHNANLKGANLCFAHMEGANCSQANLEGTYLGSAYLRDANLTASNLEKASLSNAKLKGTNLSQANMRYTTLDDAEVEGTNLSGADLERASFIHTRLSQTNMQAALLRNATFSSPDLTEVNLQEANLEGANLCGVSLRGLDFRSANLSSTHLEGTDLSNALLQGANLAYTHLERARLNETNLEGLDLSSTYLEESESDAVATLLVALRNSKLYKKSKVADAWSGEFVSGHTYSRKIFVNEDGSVTFDRIFAVPHPYEPGYVYKCTNEVFLSIEDLISHVQENWLEYQDVRPDEKEWYHQSGYQGEIAQGKEWLE
ncbi:MAG TPA: pentapeptide repeat-containing protein [Ktedonosporobacter sp.]|nr:pentapeptide repeat-containing protein [Ktedonosporobacter sp.]